MAKKAEYYYTTRPGAGKTPSLVQITGEEAARWLANSLDDLLVFDSPNKITNACRNRWWHDGAQEYRYYIALSRPITKGQFTPLYVEDVAEAIQIIEGQVPA